MGACAGKLRQAPEEKEAANNSLDCSSSTIQNGLPVTKCRSSDSIKKSTLGLLDVENRVQEADATEFPLRHQVSVELAQAVDHWETNSKILDEISAEELANRYHQDTGVLLSAIEHLEQFVRHTQQQLKTPESSRDAVALARHSSDDLQPGTPPAALDNVQQTGRSQESSCQADAECKDSEVPSSSLWRMLSRDVDIAAAKQHFEDGRMLVAEKGLKEWSACHSLTLSDLIPYSDAIGFDLPELMSHCKRIRKASLLQMLQVLADEKGYSVARDQEGLRVLHKCDHGRVHFIKMEAVLPHPLERPLALAREFDLMSSWNHYVLDSSLLHVPTIWQSWVYAALWMPFPFPQMDALAQGRGYDLSEEDHSLLVSMESLAPEDLPSGAQKLPPRAAKRKHVKVLPGSLIRLEALPPAADGTPNTKGTILAIVDPRIPHVPAFLVNFVLRVVAPFAHHQIERLLEHEFDDPSKPFPQRMAAHPELYGRVQTAVSKGLEKYYSIQSVTS